MLVEDPNNKKTDEAKKYIESILKKAAEGGKGHESTSDDEDEDEEKEEQKFKGSGYRLGSEEVPSEKLADTSAAEQGQTGTTVTRTLTFWRNGFSIEDGPLMSYDDPKNKEILEQINSGRAPLALFNVQFGQRADVRVSHRLEEEYVPPKKVLKPFGGSGQRLGSVVPGAFPSSSSSSRSSAAPVAATPSNAPKLNVDTNKPVTSVQIRLADGTRLVSKFNLSHTVGDLVNFIRMSRAENAGRSFILQTQFPVKTLTDERLTLEEAGLKNSTVFQKYQ